MALPPSYLQTLTLVLSIFIHVVNLYFISSSFDSNFVSFMFCVIVSLVNYRCSGIFPVTFFVVTVLTNWYAIRHILFSVFSTIKRNHSVWMWCYLLNLTPKNIFWRDVLFSPLALFLYWKYICRILQESLALPCRDGFYVFLLIHLAYAAFRI